MNDLNLCLAVVSRSCRPLRYIRRWISRKLLEIEAWFQRTTNWKCMAYMGYQIVTWPMTSRDLQKCCEAVWSLGYPSDSFASCYICAGIHWSLGFWLNWDSGQSYML